MSTVRITSSRAEFLATQALERIRVARQERVKIAVQVETQWRNWWRKLVFLKPLSEAQVEERMRVVQCHNYDNRIWWIENMYLGERQELCQDILKAVENGSFLDLQLSHLRWLVDHV